jgi:excisionase family DNA binding protein
MATNQDELLTPSEAAKLMKVSRKTVYAWLSSAQIPSIRVGGVWRIRRGDLMPKAAPKSRKGKEAA